MAGRHVWRGAFMAGGMRGRGRAWQERRPLQRVVRILLEYILVFLCCHFLISVWASRLCFIIHWIEGNVPFLSQEYLHIAGEHICLALVLKNDGLLFWKSIICWSTAARIDGSPQFTLTSSLLCKKIYLIYHCKNQPKM